MEQRARDRAATNGPGSGPGSVLGVLPSRALSSAQAIIDCRPRIGFTQPPAPAADGQRAEIAEFLLGSLDEGEDDSDVEDAGDEEAARRVEARRRDDPACISAETLFAEMRAKYS